MNSSEYIRVFTEAIKASKHIDNLKDIVEFIDEARRWHNKLQAKLEDALSDPISYEKPEFKEEIISIAREIREVCLTAKIQYKFYKLPDDWSLFRDEYKHTLVFANYTYNNISITDLIVFPKRKKSSKTEPETNLSELNFEETPEKENKFYDKDKKEYFEVENNKLPDFE